MTDLLTQAYHVRTGALSDLGAEFRADVTSGRSPATDEQLAAFEALDDASLGALVAQRALENPKTTTLMAAISATAFCEGARRASRQSPDQLTDFLRESIALHQRSQRKLAFETLEKRGEVWVRAKRHAPGVRLPQPQRDNADPLIAIQLGISGPRPTSHAPTDEGLEFSASFGGVYADCYFPWDAVTAIHDAAGLGLEWVDEDAKRSPIDQRPAVQRPTKARERAAQLGLRVVPGGHDDVPTGVS